MPVVHRTPLAPTSVYPAAMLDELTALHVRFNHLHPMPLVQEASSRQSISRDGVRRSTGFVPFRRRIPIGGRSPPDSS